MEIKMYILWGDILCSPNHFFVEDTSYASLVPAISSKNRQFSWIHIIMKNMIVLMVLGLYVAIYNYCWYSQIFLAI